MSHPIIEQRLAISRQDTRRKFARLILKLERQIAFLEKRGEPAQAAADILRAERDELNYLMKDLK